VWRLSTFRLALLVTTLGLCLSGDRGGAADSWTIGNAQIQATLRVSAAGLVISGIANPQTGSELLTDEAPDSSVTVNGSAGAFGASAAGWILAGVQQDDTETASQLTFTFRSNKSSLVAERTYKCPIDSPTIEVWTTFRASGSSNIAVSGMTVWQLTVPSNVLQYEFGLRGDAAGAAVEDAFSLQTAVLADGEALTLDERNRSTEHFLPTIAADLAADEFFGGLAWSGSWQMAVRQSGDRMRITAAIPNVTVSVTAAQPLETPHGFFGFTPGDRGDVAAALRGFVMQGLRGGRPFQPLVTSNTWFSYGTGVDEASMKSEMENAAANGVELFVMDAGWWTGAGAGGRTDFESGLGNWQVDRARFPDGLGALSDYAHELGLRFGIWVEPERVNQSTVGRPGLAQSAWLAQNNGSLGSSKMGQICLASAPARQWILDRLSALIDEARPDYLKWDNNFWINCTRSGHGHGATDGNFAHVKGLYDILATLRERYPDLVIENCAQGGNRADFGMLRYTDTAWMDDRTGPSVHVRHNLEGLSTFFPPAYLLSFVIDEGEEPLAGGADVPLYLRSRMPGILGLTYRAADLGESDQAQLASEIGRYKMIRDVERDASATLLTGQAAPEDGPPWDAVQHVNPITGDSIVFAFQNDGGTHEIAVRPRGLTADATYTVSTLEGETVGSMRGEELMEGGLTVEESFESAARVFVLRADRPPAPIGQTSRTRRQ
jgi:alpha-galactosidase